MARARDTSPGGAPAGRAGAGRAGGQAGQARPSHWRRAGQRRAGPGCRAGLGRTQVMFSNVSPFSVRPMVWPGASHDPPGLGLPDSDCVASAVAFIVSPELRRTDSSRAILSAICESSSVPGFEREKTPSRISVFSSRASASIAIRAFTAGGVSDEFSRSNNAARDLHASSVSCPRFTSAIAARTSGRASNLRAASAGLLNPASFAASRASIPAANL